MTLQVSDVTGIGVNDQTSGSGPLDSLGVNRRDPSDVVKINDQFYVFYTKVIKHPDGAGGGLAPIWPEGYFGTLWYATSDDGINWSERGEALGRGSAGAWDSFGVFTPNIIQGSDDNFYLYYTGVKDGFANNSTTDITNIGVAQLTFDQEGLVASAARLNGGDPILAPTFGEVDAGGAPRFDSYRVDDASLLLRDYDDDGELEYGLYFKGRAQSGTPGQTKMGLAIGESPTGPFVRQNNGDPVQPEGHEVLIWAYGNGVMSLVSNVGRGLWYAEDGVQFTELTESLTGGVTAPGAYRPELTEHDYRDGIAWGVSMQSTGNRYLRHFAIDLTFAAAGADLNGDGFVDATDWRMYRNGFGADLSGLTGQQASNLGDLNGDFVNNEADFALFKAFYDDVNGSGSFAALNFAVPEPATKWLLFGGGLVSASRRRPVHWRGRDCSRNRN